MKKLGVSFNSLPHLLFALTVLAAGPLYAGTCTGPAGNEGDIIYNSAFHTYQFCNGLGWMGYKGGSTCTAPTGTYSPTSPSGSGYFVVTNTTYNGNLGGILGADADCLTELTTNTGWMGYATANSNGQLVASKVHAFTCTSNVFSGGGFCNNLMPLTTYYFANAGNPAAGGASFTTDNSGNGPNDSANWSGATYFSGTYSFWSERNPTGTTVWPSGPTNNGGGGHCSDFTSSSSGDTGAVATTNSTGQGRWSNTNTACNLTVNLVCFVNP